MGPIHGTNEFVTINHSWICFLHRVGNSHKSGPHEDKLGKKKGRRKGKNNINEKGPTTLWHDLQGKCPREGPHLVAKFKLFPTFKFQKRSSKFGVSKIWKSLPLSKISKLWNSKLSKESQKKIRSKEVWNKSTLWRKISNSRRRSRQNGK